MALKDYPADDQKLFYAAQEWIKKHPTLSQSVNAKLRIDAIDALNQPAQLGKKQEGGDCGAVRLAKLAINAVKMSASPKSVTVTVTEYQDG